jgi:hypothetical protein
MKIRKKYILFLASFALATTMISTTVLAETQDLNNRKTVGKVNSQTVGLSNDKFKGDGYEVEFKLNSQYKGGFLGEFVVTNTGDKPLENWAVKCEFPHEIISMWNGKIISHEGTKYIIKNAQWNQDIPVGGSASIGLSGKCDDKVTFPENCQVLVGKRDLKPEEYSMDFNVQSDWKQAFTGQLKITNNTNKDIEDWILEFDFDREIEYIWGLQILKHEGNHYVIKNAGYNQNIRAGQTILIGFQGHTGNVTTKPSGYKLTELLGDDYSPVDPKEPEDPEDPENVEGKDASDVYTYFAMVQNK